MELSTFFSLKSIVSLLVLLIAVGIGSFLYFTLETDFEAKPRTVLRSSGSVSNFPTEDIKQIVNGARQAWSIVDNK
jgi:hypothetical protein